MWAISLHLIILTVNSEELKKIDKDLEKHPKSSLLVVTKNQSLDAVKNLIEMGYCSFGENKVQEAKDKFTSLLNTNMNSI